MGRYNLQYSTVKTLRSKPDKNNIVSTVAVNQSSHYIHITKTTLPQNDLCTHLLPRLSLDVNTPFHSVKWLWYYFRCSSALRRLISACDDDSSWLDLASSADKRDNVQSSTLSMYYIRYQYNYTLYISNCILTLATPRPVATVAIPYPSEL